MNVEIYLHGTPDGLDVYSTSTEQDSYVDSFYSSDYRDQSMIVETKIKENRIFSYYTYFRQNVFSTKNRQGYFGLTIRTDSFMTNLQVMYQLLDVIYNQSILGIIVSEGKERKYIVSKFQVEGKVICDNIINLLSLTIKPKSIIKLDDTFLGNSGSPIMFNPCDDNCTNALNQYKSAERIIISPSASLPREQIKAKEYQNKILYIRKESEDRCLSQIDKLRKENNSLQSEIKHILSKFQNSEKEGEVLKQKICNLEIYLQESHYKVKQLSDQAELKKELAKISEPLLRLNGLLQRIGTVTMTPQKNQASIRRINTDVERGKVEYTSSYNSANKLKFFSTILVITSIILLVVLAFQILLFSKYDNNNVVDPHVKSITEVERTNETKESEEPSNMKEENETNWDNQEKTKEDFQNLRIKIEGQNTYPDGLVAETGYHIGLVNKEGNYVDSLYSIKWDCLGGNIAPPIGNKVHLRTNKSGMIMIICHLPNGSTIKRELKVYEKKIKSQSPASHPNKIEKEVQKRKNATQIDKER